MARFKCTNKNCEKNNADHIFNFYNVRWKFDNKTNKMDHELYCDFCNEKLEYIPEEQKGDINFYFASFGSQSPERKKEILKKRAADHNRTKMKDRTAEIKKRFINANKI